MLARNKIAIVVVGAGIAVASAYRFGTSDAMVSRLLRGQFAKYVRAPASFESASFTFLEGIQVRNLVVLDPDDPSRPPLVEADGAHVNYTFDALGFGPHLTKVEIDRPRVHLERTADGSMPFLHAFQIPATQAEAVPQPEIELTRGVVTFADPAILADDPDRDRGDDTHPMLALHDLSIIAKPATSRSTDWARGTVVLHGISDILGEVDLRADVGGTGTSAEVELKLPRVAVDPDLPRRFAGVTAERISRMEPRGEVAAHIRAHVEEGHDFEAVAKIDVMDLAVRVALPESEPGVPPPKPIAVTAIHGRLHYAADRLDKVDLAFQALGGSFSIRAVLDGLTAAKPKIQARLVLRDLPVDVGFRDFVPHAAKDILEAYDVRCRLSATVRGRGELASPAVTVAATIADGHVRYDGHPGPDGVRHGFPYAAEHVAGRASFKGKTVKVNAKGRHGPAEIDVRVTVELPPGRRPIPDVRVEARNVPTDEDVRVAMGENVNDWFDKWGPKGVAKLVTVRVWNEPEIDGDHDVTEVKIEMDEGASVRPWLMPVTLTGVKGRVEILAPVENGRRISVVRLVGIEGEADGFTAKVSGEIRDDGTGSREDLRIEAHTPDASKGFREALDGSPVIPQGVKDALVKLGVSGPLGATAHVKRNPDGSRGDEVDVTLRGASIRGWGDILLAARGLTGRVTHAGDTLTLHDIAGFLVMGDFSPAMKLRGRLLHISGTPQFDWHAEVPDLPLGDALEKALGPLAEKARLFWRDFHPVGSARADCVLDLRPDSDPTPFEVTLSHIRGALKPLDKLDLDNDDGTFHYDGRHATVVGLDSAIGAASVRFDAVDYEVATGRLEVDAWIRGLQFPKDIQGLLSEDAVQEIERAVPGRTLHASGIHLEYEPARRSLAISGNLSVRPRQRRALPAPGWAPEGSFALERLAFSFPEGAPVTFEGRADLEDFSLNAGLAVDRLSGPLEFSGSFGEPKTFDVSAKDATLRVEEYPLSDADIHLTLTPRGPRVELREANFMGGKLEGRVGPGDETVAYRGSFQLHGAELEKFLTFRDTPQREVASGTIDADIKFHNSTGAPQDLRGEVEMRVRDGRLAPIPVVASILSVAGFASVATLGATGTPMFTDAKARASLVGEWLDLEDAELTGPGVVVEGGNGKIGLDGRLDFSIYPRLNLDLPLVEWVVRLLQAPIPRRIHVTGTARNPRTAWEIVPTRDIDIRREPQPAGDVQAPSRDPW